MFTGITRGLYGSPPTKMSYEKFAFSRVKITSELNVFTCELTLCCVRRK